MKPVKTFLIGIVVWFIGMMFTGWIMPVPEVVGGSIVFMGINYLCYVLVRISNDSNK